MLDGHVQEESVVVVVVDGELLSAAAGGLLGSFSTGGSSRGLPDPNILVLRSVVARAFTGSFTLRGSSFSLGRIAADSKTNTKHFMKTI